MEYDYRVIPAPRRLKRRKGVSSTADLFAATLTDCINEEARSGWEYVRSETLAAEEPGGWFRRASMVEETMLVFRRPRPARGHVEPLTERGGSDDGDEAAEPHGRPLLSATRGRGPVARREPEPQAGPDRRVGPPRGGESAPPLLRPVPRFTPTDKS